MISCFLSTLEAVEEFTGNRRSYEAFDITENKTWENLQWEVKEFGNESLMRVSSNGRNQSENREWEKRNEKNKMRVSSNSESLGNSALQKMIRNYHPEILQSTKV